MATIEIIPSYDNCTLEEFVYGGNIPPGWEEFFSKDAVKAEIVKIGEFLKKQRTLSEAPIYPEMANIFEIFYRLAPRQIRVIICGADPYINGEAQGMAFSIPSHDCHSRPIPFPPTLKNIFNELLAEGEMKEFPQSGDMSKWVTQGVFLINTSLTVLGGASGSHLQVWKGFSDLLFDYLDTATNAIVVAWGGPAQKLLTHFTKERHPVLFSSHPSPLGYNKTATPFKGCGHFTRINQILVASKLKPIDWNL